MTAALEIDFRGRCRQIGSAMKSLPNLLLALVLVSVCTIQAKDVAAAHYIAPTAIDLKKLLPSPPADGSAETKAEIDLILQKQQARTPEEVARIKSEVKIQAFVFADLLGPWFAEKNLPLTAALFKNVDEDAHPVIASGKAFWNRPRPPLQDKRVQPPIDIPTNASYPSGHSTVSELYAQILAQLMPDLKDELLQRGRLIGDDRVLAGVHFPSDVAAGKILGDALFAKFMASDAFQADLAKAKAEVAAARPKK